MNSPNLGTYHMTYTYSNVKMNRNEQGKAGACALNIYPYNYIS